MTLGTSYLGNYGAMVHQGHAGFGVSAVGFRVSGFGFVMHTWGLGGHFRE